jgi:hypothetical protein
VRDVPVEIALPASGYVNVPPLLVGPTPVMENRLEEMDDVAPVASVYVSIANDALGTGKS